MNFEYDYNEFPLAYLITLRTYGTWLHGDKKLSVDRKFNKFGTPKRSENIKLKNSMSQELKNKPFLFDENQREIIKTSIVEVCEYRNYKLQAINVRSNHVHIVVSAQIKPKLIIEAFKSYATRTLRQKNLGDSAEKIWARGGSRRYLWKTRYVSLAIEYVLYGQGDIIPDIVDCPEIYE
jgi:REP element-mobilizing transposase RayT